MEIDCFQKKLTLEDWLRSRDMMLVCPGFGCSGDQAATHLLPGVLSVWACLTVGSCLWVEINENTGDVTMHAPILQHRSKRKSWYWIPCLQTVIKSLQIPQGNDYTDLFAICIMPGWIRAFSVQVNNNKRKKRALTVINWQKDNSDQLSFPYPPQYSHLSQQESKKLKTRKAEACRHKQPLPRCMFAHISA